jgi:hypothetical protein
MTRLGLESIVLDTKKKSFLKSLIQDPFVLSRPGSLRRHRPRQGKRAYRAPSGEMGDSSKSVERRLNDGFELAEAAKPGRRFCCWRPTSSWRSATRRTWSRTPSRPSSCAVLPGHPLLQDQLPRQHRPGLPQPSPLLVDLDEPARNLIWQTFLAKAAAKTTCRSRFRTRRGSYSRAGACR